MKSTDPGQFLIIFALRYIFIRFYFQIYYSKKPKIPCCTFLLLILCCVLSRLFIQSTTKFTPSTWQFLAPLPEEGLTTPHMRRVANICSLCAGTIYIVLLGSPTRLIPWFHNWGKYLPCLYCIKPSFLEKYRCSFKRHQHAIVNMFFNY